jgi:ribosome-associated protein
MKISAHKLRQEVWFQSSRSGGKGGQHANKTESKVIAYFHVDGSAQLNDRQKQRIKRKLKNRITKDGILQVSAEAHRSQAKNKEVALNKLEQLLKEATKRSKKRIPTKPGKQAKEERLKEKRIRSEKKEMRKKVKWKGG